MARPCCKPRAWASRPKQSKKGSRTDRWSATSVFRNRSALGWKIDKIEQTRDPIISKVHRETEFVKIEPGLTAGCTHTAKGFVAGKPVIHLIHPQQVHPHLENVQTGDYIEIKGEPDVVFSSGPEIPGGIGTIALAVNMIPQVVTSLPGMKTMADLPAPASIMGDIRQLIADRK